MFYDYFITFLLKLEIVKFHVKIFQLSGREKCKIAIENLLKMLTFRDTKLSHFYKYTDT